MGMKNPFEDAERYRTNIIITTVRSIRKFYKDLFKDIKKDTDRLDPRSDKTDRIWLNNFSIEVEKKLLLVGNKIEPLIKINSQSTVERVLDNNRLFLNNLGFYNYRVDPKIVSNMVDMVITGRLYNGRFSLSSSIWGNNQRVIRDINRIVSRGIAKGQSTYEIAKNLEKYVNPDYAKTIYGSQGSVDYNAERLARTMVQHAYQEAFVSATINNPFIEAYRWVTSGAHNVCAVCIERETMDDYGLGEGIYPKDQLPLDHPNGNCTFEIVTSWDEESARQAVMDWAVGDGDPELNEELDYFAETLR